MNKEYSLTKSAHNVLYEDNVEGIKLSIPENAASVGFYYLQEPEACDFHQMMTQAMEAPYGTPSLHELAKGKHSAAIIVSDATRAVQTAMVLPYVVKELNQAGIGLEQLKVIVALGVHRAATKAEMASILGQYNGKIVIENHDPFSSEKLTVLGKTSAGTTVEVNTAAYNAELRVSIGKIEPHEFAGFSGGRKSVLPGIASEKCIVHNHRPEMILNPNAVAGVLDGNPVHMDMLETAKMLGIDFTVNLVQNAKGDPIGVFAGDLEEAHRRGVDFVNQYFGITLTNPSDIYLVTPGRPLNIDLYQSVKALIAMTSVVKKGDIIIFYSKCTEGVNSEDMVKPFKVSEDLEEVLKFVVENYKIQMDHALLLCKLYQKGVKVLAYTPGVDNTILSLMHMLPVNSLQEAISTALQLKDRNGDIPQSIAVIPTPQRAIIRQDI